MLKAILIIMAIGADGHDSTIGDYTVELEIPSMEECLDMRIAIAEQEPSLKTLCLPIKQKQFNNMEIQDFFDEFMRMNNDDDDIPSPLSPKHNHTICCDEEYKGTKK